jgi:hypothetical protein
MVLNQGYLRQSDEHDLPYTLQVRSILVCVVQITGDSVMPQ